MYTAANEVLGISPKRTVTGAAVVAAAAAGPRASWAGAGDAGRAAGAAAGAAGAQAASSTASSTTSGASGGRMGPPRLTSQDTATAAAAVERSCARYKSLRLYARAA